MSAELSFLDHGGWQQAQPGAQRRNLRGLQRRYQNFGFLRMYRRSEPTEAATINGNTQRQIPIDNRDRSAAAPSSIPVKRAGHQLMKQKSRSMEPEKRALAPCFESRPLFLFLAPGSARCHITLDSVATHHTWRCNWTSAVHQKCNPPGPRSIAHNGLRRAESKPSHARLLVESTRRILHRLLMGTPKRWREFKATVEEHTSREKAVRMILMVESNNGAQLWGVERWMCLE
ncbi:hypothetical protein JB92DRAFT_2832292 [Gautieria morchelliformis]|nr:hypothetical protein JB92DRAFT_2832292 [Gautieria morchelliformis]